MKRGRKAFEMLLVSLLLPLVLTLAYLQYSWLKTVSAVNRERMLSSITMGAKQFAGELNSQLSLIPLMFQLDPSDADAGRWERFSDQWAFWFANAPLATLVKEIYLIPRLGAVGARPDAAEARTDANGAWGGASPSIRRYDPEKKAFLRLDARAETPELAAILRELSPARPTPSDRSRTVDGAFLTIPAVIAPVKDAGSDGSDAPPEAYVCVVLDRFVLERTLIPSLVQDAWAGGLAELNVRVIDTQDKRVIYPMEGKENDPTVEGSDFVMSVPTTSAKTMIVVSKLSAMGSAPSEITRDLDLSSVLTMFMTRKAASAEALKQSFTMRLSPDLPDLPAIPPLSGWVLAVNHKAGSLDAAIAQGMARNLAVSFGILLILASSVILLYVSYGRARDLSHREGEFVAGVSHEFRTPLAVICSAGENLSDGVVKDEERVKGYGRLVVREGQRLRDMVEKVLSLAARRNGSVRADAEEADIVSIVESLASEYAGACEEKGISLHVDVDPSLGSVKGNGELVRSAVRNLLANAVLHGGDGKWIRIGASRSTRGRGAEAVIAVEDHGKGIPRRELSRVFEPFYRGDRAMSAQVPGTGLGLAVVKRAVELHGGRVSVAGAPENGCTFTIRLPLAPDSRRGA